MKLRFTNPKHRYSDDFLNNLPIQNIEGVDYRVLVRDERYKIPFCQCYRDCSCNPDTLYGEIVTYYRDVIFDNTNKAFHTDPHYKRKELPIE